MFWLFWLGLALLLLVLLAVSWWYDRSARRRGATPRSGKEVSRARWRYDRDVAQEVSQANPLGMTPRSSDAARDSWRGR